MNNYVIVAIPRADEEVWKVSSETVPHMTILNLGESVDPGVLRGIKDYLEHVAETSLTRFGCSVDRRGELGPKPADVLFFEKGWSTKEIEDARGYLLKNFGILLAYNSTEQYPEWTPHLTLGYPDAPAKEPEDRYGLNYVNFDKIALWNGNYEGWEFDLKSLSMAEEVPVAYHDAVAHVKSTMRLDRPLSEARSAGTSLSHAKKVTGSFTGIIASLNEDQQDLFDMVFGSLAVDEEIPEELGYGDVYDTLSDSQRNALHFMVGSFLKNKSSYLEQDGMYDTAYLEHYGVKGMQWGVEKPRATSGATKKFSTAAKAKKEAIGSSLTKATAAVTGLSNNPKYRGKDLNANPTLKAQYDNEAKASFRKILVATTSTIVVGGTALALSPIVPTFVTAAVGGIGARTASQRAGNTSNVSDPDEMFTLQAQSDDRVSSTPLQQSALATDVELDETPTTYRLVPKRDGLGHIVSYSVKTVDLAQFEEEGVFLAHFGVKGMKWGVRKDRFGSSGRLSKATDKANRAETRAKVKSGTATLGEAHIAATKSTGHRVFNGIIGDKRYWANELKIAGIYGAGLAATAAAAFGLPDDVLTNIAESFTGGKEVGGKIIGGTELPANKPNVKGIYISSSSAVEIGRSVVGTVGVGVAGVTSGVLGTANSVANVTRAFRGNKNVDKSYAALGNQVANTQYSGSKATKNLLKKDGGLRGKRLKQAMDLDRPYSAAVDAASDDALQFGIRGMKWGVRRSRGANGRVSGSAPKPTKKQRREANKLGLHTLSDDDLKKLTERINLETNYKTAVTNASTIKSFNSKAKNLVDLGRTANDAVAFAGSPAGQLLLNKLSPQLAVTAANAAKLAKAADDVSKKGNSANKQKAPKEDKTPTPPKAAKGNKNLPDARERRPGPFGVPGGQYPRPFY